jgi:hypothetical protein
MKPEQEKKVELVEAKLDGKLRKIIIEIQVHEDEGIQSVLVNGVESIDDDITSFHRGAQEEWMIEEDVYTGHDLVLILTE